MLESNYVEIQVRILKNFEENEGNESNINNEQEIICEGETRI